jgi:hypothetical protein
MEIKGAGAAAGATIVRTIRGHGAQLEHDAIMRNRIMLQSLCLSMIFSENRFPLFRIML